MTSIQLVIMFLISQLICGVIQVFANFSYNSTSIRKSIWTYVLACFLTYVLLQLPLRRSKIQFNRKFIKILVQIVWTRGRWEYRAHARIHSPNLMEFKLDLTSINELKCAVFRVLFNFIIIYKWEMRKKYEQTECKLRLALIVVA